MPAVLDVPVLAKGDSSQRPSAAKRRRRQPGRVIQAPCSRMIAHHSTTALFPSTTASPKRSSSCSCIEVARVQ